MNAPTDKSGGFGRLTPPVDRIAEILEALFMKEPELTAALLDELGRADTAMLAKLSGSPSTPTDTLAAYGPVPLDPAATELQLAAETPAAERLPAEPGPVAFKARRHRERERGAAP